MLSVPKQYSCQPHPSPSSTTHATPNVRCWGAAKADKAALHIGAVAFIHRFGSIVGRDLLENCDAKDMLACQHSGFSSMPVAPDFEVDQHAPTRMQTTRLGFG